MASVDMKDETSQPTITPMNTPGIIKIGEMKMTVSTESRMVERQLSEYAKEKPIVLSITL